MKDEVDKEIARIRAHAERRAKRAEERARVMEAMQKATDDLRIRLEDDCGTRGHPKADLLWQKAWEHGHAYGLSEVEIWYHDLVELIL